MDVPQQRAISQAMEQNDLVSAQSLACLGATEANWKQLGMRALRQGVLSVAKNAFERLKDIRYLSFIENLQRDSEGADSIIGIGKLDYVNEAELMAYEGQFNEAAKIYSRNGRPDEATRIFTDLRMWEEAKTFAQAAGQNIRDLNEKQAQWMKEIKDWKGAASLRSNLGQVHDAVKIVIDAQEDGWEDYSVAAH